MKSEKLDKEELMKILEKYDANNLKTFAMILEIFDRIGYKLKNNEEK